MKSKAFGWDLVRKAHRDDLKKPSDVVVAALHWRLLMTGLGSVGVGENFSISSEEALSELLPENWAGSDVFSYAIRYRLREKNSEKYLLKVSVLLGLCRRT